MRFVSIDHREFPVSRVWISMLVLLAVGFWGILATSPQTHAQESDRPDSLDIVPQTASFYLASMNHAAQYKAVINSNAYKQLMACDVAKRMRKAYRSGRRKGFRQFGNNPFAEYLQNYTETVGSVPGKMILNYLGDIFGNEIFVYGDQDWIDMSRALGNFYEDAGATMENVDPNEMDESTIHKLLEIAARHLNDVNTPHLVIGTVLDSPGGTKSLLQIAEAGIDQLLSQVSEELDYIANGYEVIEEDDLYILSLQLDSKMMPWEDVVDDPDIGPYVEDIKAIVANKSINISIGVKGQYFLFSIGPNADHIRNLGKGDLLIDHPKLAALKKAAARHPVTSVRYTSEEMAAYSQESIPGVVDSILSFAKVALQSAPPEVQEGLAGLTDDLEADAEELKKDLAASLARSGARLGFSYLIDNGFEGYVYNWAENKYLDDSGPLTILDHVGSSPTAFFASRDKGSRLQYVMARKWFSRLYDRVAKYVPRIAPGDDAQLFVEFSGKLRDVLSRVADSTDENFLSATKDGQSAIVMDFSTRNHSWHVMMPPSDVELPIPSLSALIEHHDKQKIVAAGSSYLAAGNDILEMIRDYPDSDVPDDVQIPVPEKRSAFGGDLYYFTLPTEAGVDESIAFHALVRDDLLVLGYSLDQTERLISGDPPEFQGLLSDRSRNLMSVSYYNHRELVDALNLWSRYGIDQAKEQGLRIEMDQDVKNDTLAFKEPELLEALDHIVALIRCLESCSSMSYREDGVQVTHSQMLFSDVPEN